MPALGLIMKAPLSVTGLRMTANLLEHWTNHEIDLVALDEGFDLGNGDVGLEFVILNEELDVSRPPSLLPIP